MLEGYVVSAVVRTSADTVAALLEDGRRWELLMGLQDLTGDVEGRTSLCA